EMRDPLGTFYPDRIRGKQIFIFVHALRKHGSELSYFVVEIERWFQRQPAHTKVRGHHALAGDHLEDAENVFALAEAIKEDGHGAHVERMRSQPDQMRGDARQLIQHHANELRARWHLHLQQLFYCEHIPEVVGHGTEVVDAVSQRDYLLIELGL